MTKIEKIIIPDGIHLEIVGTTLKVANKEFESSINLEPFFEIKIDEKGFLLISLCSEILNKSRLKKRRHRFFSPLLTTLKKKIEQLFFGFSVGFTKQLDLIGVGYKVSKLSSSNLVLKLGFSHEVTIKIPKTIQIFSPKDTLIILKSYSKEILGTFVSQVQRLKMPDVYKNKGIVRKEEILYKKKFKKK